MGKSKNTSSKPTPARLSRSSSTQQYAFPPLLLPKSLHYPVAIVTAFALFWDHRSCPALLSAINNALQDTVAASTNPSTVAGLIIGLLLPEIGRLHHFVHTKKQEASTTKLKKAKRALAKLEGLIYDKPTFIAFFKSAELISDASGSDASISDEEDTADAQEQPFTPITHLSAGPDASYTPAKSRAAATIKPAPQPATPPHEHDIRCSLDTAGLASALRTKPVKQQEAPLPSSSALESPRDALLRSHDIKLVEYRARGTFGLVYTAQVISTGELVCVKEICSSRQAEEDMRGEIAMLCRFSGLVNFLSFRKFIEGTDGRKYLVTDLCDIDLERLLAITGAMPHYVIVFIGLQVLNGLIVLRDAGVTHRDIKPLNLFLKGLTIKIGDFGCSSTKLEQSTIGGTEIYNAPEVGKGVYDGQARDLFAAIKTLQYLHCPDPNALAYLHPTDSFESAAEFEAVLELGLRSCPILRGTAAEIRSLPFFKRAGSVEQVKEFFDVV